MRNPQQVFYLHPTGWESDPEEERFPLSTLDYLSALNWTNYALFFRLEDAGKDRAVDLLKAGLSRTLAQARHCCATIERDAIGSGYSFVRKRDSTVRFVVQRLDSAEDADEYPSIDELEASHFRVGDRRIWGVPGLLHGYGRPEAHPDRSPEVAGFQANLVRGGLVLNIHQHHYANDILGFAGFVHQLAENCYAILHSTAPPPWDPACLDVSRFTKPEPADESEMVDSPPQPGRHPDHLDAQWLLFHLPKSKAAELKRLARPAADGEGGGASSWISTYDAFVAFIWRTFSRVRAPVFKPDMSSSLFWIEAVDMRRRVHSPGVHPRTQHNVMAGASSLVAPVPQPTAAQVISEWPYARLAQHVRQMTDSVTQEALGRMLEAVARFRDKTTINIRVDAKPPLSMLVTDHRDTNIAAADFGFARPITYRHLSDNVDVPVGIVIVYPPRRGGGGSDPDYSDEGSEFAVSFETSLTQALLSDPEWCEYFEFRGVDGLDVHVPSKK